MEFTSEILTEIKKFNRNVEWLKQRDAKNIGWVPANVVMNSTGWDKEGLRRAREQGYVKFKGEGKKMVYDLSSINNAFLINK